MHYEFTPKEIERFWARVDRRGPDECWEWTGCRTHYGYGMFWVTPLRRPLRANRVICMMAGSDLPKGIVAAHTCDNPSCCNPRHIVAMTQLENIADCNRKGRQDHGPNAPKRTPAPKRGIARGERAGRAKLTAAQVREIRSRYVAGKVGYTRLAKEYGVNDYAIESIIKRKTWKHVA